MADAEIYANPERILALADDLSRFTGNLRNELEKMSAGLQNLGATWQDEEYRKFKRSFDRLKEDFGRLGHEISKREPELKEDAQLLRDFLLKTSN